MKYLDLIPRTRAFQARNQSSGFRTLGITSRGQHDARRRAAGPNRAYFAQPFQSDRFKDIYQGRPQANENGLRLRVAKSNIVFKYPRTIRGQHQTDEEYALKRKAFGAGARQSRFNNVSDDAI